MVLAARGTRHAVGGTTAVTAYIAIRTGLPGWNAPPSRKVEECLRDAVGDLADAVALGWPALRARHVPFLTWAVADRPGCGRGAEPLLGGEVASGQAARWKAVQCGGR